MTASDRVRRSSGWAAPLGIALVTGLALMAGLAPAASGAELPATLSRLESPMADVAVLPPVPDAAPDTTPMLLVLDAERIVPNVARLSVLRRGSTWDRIEVLDIDLEAVDLDDAWLVDLGEGRFSLIATTPRDAPGSGHSVAVGIEAREEAGSPVLSETGRSRFDTAIEASGAADVDGLGAAELVVGLRPTDVGSGSCATTSLRIVDSATATVRRSVDLPSRLGHGAIGRWDAVPGDDLLAYGTADCPAGGDLARVLTVRLRDGTTSTLTRLSPAREVSAVPPPLRVRFDGVDADRALLSLDEGLALIDGQGGEPHSIARGAAVPLVAGPDPDSFGPAQRIAWLDPRGFHTERIRPADAGGLAISDRLGLGRDALDDERWDLATAGMIAALQLHGGSSAWLGSLDDEGCPNLVLPGAILPCGTDELRRGATWVATRIVATMPIEGRQTAIVAAGLAWDPAVGVPATPTPSVGAPAGWWRHGPSTAFAISEVRASDIVYFRDFPVPNATIETATDRDGRTKLPGFTGTRLFVSVVPLADDQEGPDVAPSRIDSLMEPPSAGGVVRIVRVPVPAGNESGRDGSFTTLDLAGITRSGTTSTNRWALRVVPINDWGEVGLTVVRTIARDAVGPTLNLETPFTNPVWPFLTHLKGRTEPGSEVSIDGQGPLEVDERGRFTVVTRLAPWPQTIRLTATDASDNASVAEFSIVGGVDYRQFPWALIVALTLLGIVAVRGLRAAGRRAGGVEATAWSMGVLDDALIPEIEELPPGKGLAPADRGLRR